jgi:RNA polymerase sigma factor (sigma-70 family)
MSAPSIGLAIRRLAAPSGTCTEPDAVLLDRWARDGDQTAFELLVWRHGAMVLSVCRRALLPADAEDAFQATFLVLVRKAGSVGRRGSLGGWLHRVAVRTCRAARRRGASRPLPLEVEPQAPAGAECDDLRVVLDEELDRMPARFRQAVVLCHLQEKTVEEAAAELGCPRGTVLSRLLRGRRKLKARLARRGVVAPAVAVAVLTSAGATAAWPASRLVGLTVEVASGRPVVIGAGWSVPTPADRLAREVLNAMRMKLVTTVVAAVFAVVLGVGAGLNWSAAEASDRQAQPAKARAGGAKPADKPADKPDPKKELEKLQGDWTIANMEMGGEKLPDVVAEKMGYAFGPEKITIKGKLAQAGAEYVVRDGSEDFKFKIDPSKKIAEIDIEIKEGEFAKGIYKFDGKELILCIDYSRTDRPEKFETKDQPAFALYRLKKADK